MSHQNRVCGDIILFVNVLVSSSINLLLVLTCRNTQWTLQFFQNSWFSKNIVYTKRPCRSSCWNSFIANRKKNLLFSLHSILCPLERAFTEQTTAGLINFRNLNHWKPFKSVSSIVSKTTKKSLTLWLISCPDWKSI